MNVSVFPGSISVPIRIVRPSADTAAAKAVYVVFDLLPWLPFVASDNMMTGADITAVVGFWAATTTWSSQLAPSARWRSALWSASIIVWVCYCEYGRDHGGLGNFDSLIMRNRLMQVLQPLSTSSQRATKTALRSRRMCWVIQRTIMPLRMPL